MIDNPTLVIIIKLCLIAMLILAVTLKENIRCKRENNKKLAVIYRDIWSLKHQINQRLDKVHKTCTDDGLSEDKGNNDKYQRLAIDETYELMFYLSLIKDAERDIKNAIKS